MHVCAGGPSGVPDKQRYWYFIAEQPAPAPHLAHPEGCAALRIVLVTVPRVSRSCENFPDGFDLHLLQHKQTHRVTNVHLSPGLSSDDVLQGLHNLRKGD